MTTRGIAFKTIAHKVVVFHGFGSRKTVTEYPCCFHLDGFGEDDVNWLIENGYIFHRTVERSRSRGRYGQYGRVYRTDDDFGITEKGWAVAHLYLES